MNTQSLPLFPDDQPKPRNYRNVKGATLENAFAEWLVKEEGYERTKRNVPVNGKTSERFYDVDIHAVKAKYEADKINLLIIVTTIIAVVAAYKILNVAAGGGLLVLGGIAWFAAKSYFENAEEHAWVECKNQLGTVKRQQMQKLISAVQDVKDNGSGAKWTPDRVFLWQLPTSMLMPSISPTSMM